MKTCSKCGAQVPDDAAFCTVCGFNFSTAGAPQGAPHGGPQPQPQYQQMAAPAAAQFKPVNPCDKMLAILALVTCLSPLSGFLGFIIAYYGGEVNGQRSDYLKFYSNEAMVFALFSIIDCIPFIGWIWGIFRFICAVIAVVDACKGECKPVLFFGTLKVVK